MCDGTRIRSAVMISADGELQQPKGDRADRLWGKEEHPAGMSFLFAPLRVAQKSWVLVGKML